MAALAAATFAAHGAQAKPIDPTGTAPADNVPQNRHDSRDPAATSPRHW